MAKKVTQIPTAHQMPTHVEVRPRTPFEWKQLLEQAAEEHWRKIRITIQLREWLMAGKPAQLDAANAMLKARGLEAAIEAVNVEDPTELAEAAEKATDEGLCEFHRREGKPGIWFPTNNIKAGLKENWSVLGLRVEHRGSRGAIAEGVFVYAIADEKAAPSERDWIYLGEKPFGTHTAVSHTTGPKGPVSSIKRHEYLVKPKITFEIALANAIKEKLPDEALAKTLVHFSEHGMGACRSQGYGRFDILDMTELGVEDEAKKQGAA